MHHSTKGGSSDTEVKLLTVIPIWDVCADPAVITAIPVGKQPRAARKALVSKSICHLGRVPLHTRLMGIVHDRSKVRRRGEKTARPDPGLIRWRAWLATTQSLSNASKKAGMPAITAAPGR